MNVPGGHTGGATPVPIPNTEVKPSKADATAAVRQWESRTLPGYNKGPLEHSSGPFLFGEVDSRLACRCPVLARRARRVRRILKLRAVLVACAQYGINQTSLEKQPKRKLVRASLREHGRGSVTIHATPAHHFSSKGRIPSSSQTYSPLMIAFDRW
jgi:hypothetical protein